MKHYLLSVLFFLLVFSYGKEESTIATSKDTELVNFIHSDFDFTINESKRAFSSLNLYMRLV